MLPNHSAPAQEWIDAGLATPSPKAANADFRQMTFDTAQANALVHLTGRGAEELDREARRRPEHAGVHR